MKYHLWMNNISGTARTNKTAKMEPSAKTVKGKNNSVLVVLLVHNVFKSCIINFPS